jgi:hypothetical protein
MREYFKEAVLCIAAEDAASDEEGFLNFERQRETAILILVTNPGEEKVILETCILVWI